MDVDEIKLDRSHYVDTIRRLFTAEVPVVFLDGADGAGKTEIAQQFIQSDAGNAISLFLHSPTQWRYDTTLIRSELLDEASRLLGRDCAANTSSDLVKEWHAAVIALDRRAKKRKQPIYFVVDGLDLLRLDDLDLARSVLELLPIGLKSFKAIISRNPEHQRFESVCANSRVFTVPGFSLDDVKRYFSTFDCTEADLDSLLSICDGMPIRLATVRRCLLSTEETLATLLPEISTRLPDLFEVEWRQAEGGDDHLMGRALSIIAHCQHTPTVELLARLLDSSCEEVRKSIDSLTFLVIADSGEVHFVNNAFSAFATQKLRDSREDVLNLIIDDLLNSGLDDTKVTQLPAYLESAGRIDDLFGMLTPEFFGQALESLRSLAPLQRSAQVGLSAAKSRDNDKYLLQFALNSSALRQLDSAEALRCEVLAHLSLDDNDAAIDLANSMVLREDRLELLALVARNQKEKGAKVGDELIEQIRSGFAEVDLSMQHARRERLALDLAFVCPDLCAKIQSDTSDSTGSADLSIFGTILAAENQEPVQHGEKLGNLEELRCHIANPKIRHLANIVTTIFGESDGKQLLSDVKHLGNLELQIGFIGSWLLNNRRSPSALFVACDVVRDIVASREYTPNARDAAILAEVLPHQSSRDAIQPLVDDLALLDPTLKKNGPTNCYVRVHLLLAEGYLAQAEMELASAEVAFVGEFVSELDDLHTRTDCLASLVAFFTICPAASNLEEFTSIRRRTQEEFDKCFEELRCNTAYQYIACGSAVRILAKGSLAKAVEYAKQLNTEPRRDSAIQDAIRVHLTQNEEGADLSKIALSLDEIGDPIAKGQCLGKMLRFIAECTSTSYDQSVLMALFNRVEETVLDAEDRAEALCSAQVIVAQWGKEDLSGFEKKLKERMEKAWSENDMLWIKMRSAFSIARLLADTDATTAKDYLRRGNELKQQSIYSDDAAWTALSSIRLTISAFSGLLRRQKDNDDDLSNIAALISEIPSYGEQTLLWADVAQRYVIAGRETDAKNIVNQRVLPCFEQIPSGDHAYKCSVFVRIAPILYTANPLTTEERIVTYDPQVRDRAYGGIVGFMLRKEPLFEPFEDPPHSEFSITHDESTRICKLLEQVEDDSVVGYVGRAVAASALKRKNRFTRENKADIARRFEKIAESGFSSPRFLQHDGFRHLMRALALKLRNGDRTDWNDLISSVAELTNTADRVFLQAFIAGQIPSKQRDVRDGIVSQVESAWQSIPSVYDQTHRLEQLSETVHQFDPKKCRELIRKTMEVSEGIGPRDSSRVQRRILDFAHRVDPDIAREFVKAFDDDPARVFYRQSLNDHLEVLETRRLLPSRRGQDKVVNSETQENALATERLPDLAWRSLGALHAGRMVVLGLKELRDEVEQAAALPPHQSYPVLAWVIANATKRYADTDQVGTLLRPLFDSTLLTSQLTLRVIGKTASNRPQPFSTFQHTSSRTQDWRIVGPNNREQVLSFIREWLAEGIGDYLKICDPYFGVDELDFLRLIDEVHPGLAITVLASQNHQMTCDNVEELYRKAWGDLSVGEAPNAHIILIGTNEPIGSPIHDRVWIAQRSGIEFGSSLNSTGVSNISKVRRLSDSEASEWEATIDPYLQHAIRLHRGVRLMYNSFSL